MRRWRENRVYGKIPYRKRREAGERCWVRACGPREESPRQEGLFTTGIGITIPRWGGSLALTRSACVAALIFGSMQITPLHGSIRLDWQSFAAAASRTSIQTRAGEMP